MLCYVLCDFKSVHDPEETSCHHEFCARGLSESEIKGQVSKGKSHDPTVNRKWNLGEWLVLACFRLFWKVTFQQPIFQLFEELLTVVLNTIHSDHITSGKIHKNYKSTKNGLAYHNLYLHNSKTTLYFNIQNCQATTCHMACETCVWFDI